ncbi:MAG: galactose oxidase-like domain-containing protein [Geodermatophilaceae bacterium]
MALLPPRVIGPLSECSTRVRVQAQFTGATVTIYADGVQVGTGVASWSDDVFTLSSSLAAGQQVSATQTVGLETSISSPETVQVQAKPPVVGPVGFRSHLNQCGECVWLEGLVPGAKVELRDGVTTIASGESYDGNARFHLSTPLAAGMDIKAQQEACGAPGVLTDGPPVDILVEKLQSLPTPVVEAPLHECERRVTVSNIVHGATVTLLRSAGPNQSACFDLDSLWMGVNPPLVLGETISARQELLGRCKLTSADATPVMVQDNTPVPATDVVPPLCAGNTTVVLTGLVMGARVTISADGAGLGQAESPADGSYDFLVPPLVGGTTISASQELCGEWSAPGVGVLVDPAPASLPTPKVHDPLYECGAAVRVSNLHMGGRVYVYSTLLGAPIGERTVNADEVDVPVAPLLIEGDDIYAVQRGCGLISSKSGTVPVDKLERLGPPTVVSPLYSCENAVRVADVAPGARVDVYVDGIFRGSAASGGDTVTVGVSGQLEVGDEVTAVQRLCEDISGPSKPVVVEEFQGRWFRVGGDTAAEILAVHAALLRTGKIVYFGGDQHDGGLNAGGDVDHTRLFDCTTHSVTPVTGLPGNVDLFCSGHALLADGRVLAGGGTRNWGGGGIHPGSHFIGIRDAYLFDPADDLWHATGKMVTQRPADVAAGTDIEKTGGHWYPTLVGLPDGRVLAMSGHPEVEDSRHNNNSLELYDPGSGTWSLVGAADYANIDTVDARRFEYPRLHVLPDGTVITTTPMTNGNLEKWHPYTDATDWDHVISPAPEGIYDNGFAQDTSSILLPLSPADKYRARVLVAGGSTPFILDTDNPGAGWTATLRTMTGYPQPGDVNPVRENLDTVILPTGEIFAEGGLKNGSSDTTGVKRPELYNPATNTWKVLPEAERVRGYHSVALLMPDGAVWVAGSNFNAKPGIANRELRIEIFQPWYFCGRRPSIGDAAQQACHGEEFDIRTPDAADVQKVVLVRAGSVTHNFNVDQRHISLEFRRDKGNLLVARVPDNAAVAIVGYYLLFVIDSSGRPSTGRFIQICPGTSRSGLGTDRDWWQRLRDQLDGGLDLDESEIRQLYRELLGTVAPPRRRLVVEGRHGHGGGPTPHHDHDHNHNHNHNHNGDADSD